MTSSLTLWKRVRRNVAGSSSAAGKLFANLSVPQISPPIQTGFSSIPKITSRRAAARGRRATRSSASTTRIRVRARSHRPPIWPKPLTKTRCISSSVLMQNLRRFACTVCAERDSSRSRSKSFHVDPPDAFERQASSADDLYARPDRSASPFSFIDEAKSAYGGGGRRSA
jgi:hypothetical protein